MRLNKEERYQLKLIRLAKEISRSSDCRPVYEYNPHFESMTHAFKVFTDSCSESVIWNSGFDTAKSCYEWALDECRKEGFIR